MSKIKILPKNLINLIAAGEVVERPASALKELVENSIDADAGRIIINLRGYGSELIEVVDDGAGMSKEDALMAFKQHATSKITTEEDLQNIISLGFRGEALASISSVAEKVLLETKAEGSDAIKVIAKDGNETIETSTKAEKGTKISIHNIFANVPARKKFLKSDAVELKHLTDTFLSIALANLNIHFELYHNDKLLYRLSKTQNFKDRVFEIWGKTTTANLYEKAYYDGADTKIEGYLGSPEIGKRSGNLQYIFVNKRPVTNKIVAAAIMESYRGFIHHTLKPAFFLFLDIDPQMVDVNIHPRKSEVRFINSQEIFRLILSLTRKTLQNSTKNILSSNLPETFQSESPEPLPQYRPKESYPSFVVKDTASSYRPNNPKIQEALSFTKLLITNANEESENYSNSDKSANTLNLGDETNTKYSQLFKTYIVFEKDNELIFIDQHAAAEKILFEKLYKNLGSVVTKPLLIPEVIELKPSEKDVILEKREELQKVGILIEDFGQNAIQISEIPEAVDTINIQAYLDEMLEGNLDLEKGYEEEKDVYTIPKELYMLIATTACHGSIRAGQPLTEQEMCSIVKNLSTLNNPYNCPHGRPVMWRIERGEIEKNFKRKL